MFNLKKEAIRAADAKEVGWGTPLKKRTATRIKSSIILDIGMKLSTLKTILKKSARGVFRHNPSSYQTCTDSAAKMFSSNCL